MDADLRDSYKKVFFLEVIYQALNERNIPDAISTVKAIQAIAAMNKLN